MSRRTADPEFSQRLQRIRLRLGYEKKTRFAKAMGIAPSTYEMWEAHNSAPSPTTLKQALRPLGLADLATLFLWLADGEGEAPAWLEDESLDPYAAPPVDGTPPGGGGGGPVVPAMPWSLLVDRVAPALRKVAARELTGSEGASCDLEFVELATDFEKWLRSYGPKRAAQPSGEAAESRSNLLNWPDVLLHARQIHPLTIRQIRPRAKSA